MRSVPSNFWEWAATLKGEERLAALAIGIGALVLITVAICTTIYNIYRTRAENALKRELLDRGLSADEIATIVHSPDRKRSWLGFSRT